MIKYRIFKNSAALVIDGEAYSLAATHPQYDKLISLAKEQNKDEILKILNHEELQQLGLTLKDGTIYYKNLALPNFFYNKFLKIKTKKELIPIVNTWYNLEQKLSILDKKRFGVFLKDSYLVWDDSGETYLYESNDKIFENTSFFQVEYSALFKLIYDNYGTVQNYIKETWAPVTLEVLSELKRIVTTDQRMDLQFLQLGPAFSILTTEECLDLLKQFNHKNKNTQVVVNLALPILNNLTKSQLKKFMPELLSQRDILANFIELLGLSPEYKLPDFSSITELRTIINREIQRYDGTEFSLKIDLTNPRLYQIHEAVINEELKIIIPHHNVELIEWGQKLNHCIGGYGKRISQGKTYCFGIVDAKNNLLYTIEYHGGKIIQFMGKNNQSVQGLHREHYRKVIEFLQKESLLKENLYNNY